MELIGCFLPLLVLEFLLIIGCNGIPIVPVSDLPNVRFTIGGHDLQMSILTEPASDFEDGTLSSNSFYGIIEETPTHGKSKVPVKLHKKLQAYDKLKKLYEDLGVLMRLHEDELSMDNEANDNIEEPKSTDGGIQNARTIVPEIAVQEGRRKDNLNIQVNAKPPLQMRTFLRYPKKPEGKEPFSSNISIYPRSSQAVLDSPNLSTTEDSEKRYFTQRVLPRFGLKLWEKYQETKKKNISDKQQLHKN